MIYLGIDFGLKKVGLALAISKIADPYLVVRYQNKEELVKRIKGICQKEKIDKIIVGISEGQMAINSTNFAQKLKERINNEVVLFDETLSTYDAQKLGIEAGMKRSKRKSMEDAIAAAVMLQNYLDSN